MGIKLSCGRGLIGSKLHATQAQKANAGLTRGQTAEGSIIWLALDRQQAVA